MKKYISPLLWITSLTALFIALFYLQALNKFESNFLDDAKSVAITLTRSAAQEVETILQNVMTTADSLATDISSGKINKNNLHVTLKEIVDREEYFYGVAVAYEPYSYESDRKLYAPYYVKKEGAAKLVQIESIYDYTEKKHAWYSSAIEQGSIWLEPFYGKAGKVLETVYSVPFYETQDSTEERKPSGVVTIALPIDYLAKIIQNLDLGPNGFGALLSKKGVYLYHPNSEYSKKLNTIFEIAESTSDQDRIVLGQKALHGERALVDHKSTTTGLESWLISEPIPTTGWALQNTFVKSDTSIDVTTPRRLLMKLSASIVFLLLSLSALFLGRTQWNKRNIWRLSAIAAILFTAGIGVIWVTALSNITQMQKNNSKITDNKTLQQIIQSHEEQSARFHTAPPVFIPTGIHIQSLNFSNNKDLSVVGYVWQTYKKGVHDDLPKGFVIPGAEVLNVSDPSSFADGNNEVFRWSFTAKIQQNIQSLNYPLEQESIGIKLQHLKMHNNVFLVPDLSSYKVLSPSSLPGLDEDVFAKGWEVKQSYFELKDINRKSSFGNSLSVSQSNFPILQFSLLLKRNFIHSFISSLTPLLVVAFLLFIILLQTTNDKELMVRFGAGSARTLSMCAALFFVIIFAHIDTRKTISTGNMFYLEYFYLALYGALLCVSVNALLFVTSKESSFIKYQDNIIAKVAYWPGLTLLLFGITIYQFY